MRKRRRPSCGRIAIIGIAAIVGLCLATVGLLALSNSRLPTQSAVVDRLTGLDKARLAEATHLRQALGDQVWPGWGQADIPIIVSNEANAFLTGYAAPPAGWMKMPAREQRGSEWRPVSGDTFEGQTYYRQPLPDPDVTPENFTVLVGDRWAATMGTKEYMEIGFYQGFRQDLPPVVRELFPYRLLWANLMDRSETYIQALEHEAFHAFQGSVAPDRLAAAERANRAEGRYPWDDAGLQEAWHAELKSLQQAALAKTEGEVGDLAREFLARRDQRRKAAGLDAELIDYERQREWLEGLAKYAELAIGWAAGAAADYAPVAGLTDDPDFHGYSTRERFWQQQMGEVTRSASREGETRFYYGGMAQAVVLDRLLPGWKERAFRGETTLEDLLREATR